MLTGRAVRPGAVTRDAHERRHGERLHQEIAALEMRAATRADDALLRGRLVVLHMWLAQHGQ